MKNGIWLIGLLLVSGCVQHRWTHPNFNEQSWKKDTYECERDMRQSAYFGGGILGSVRAQEFGERCLEARGYTKEQVN
jgi:hypothetical protein